MQFEITISHKIDVQPFGFKKILKISDLASMSIKGHAFTHVNGYNSDNLTLFDMVMHERS